MTALLVVPRDGSPSLHLACIRWKLPGSEGVNLTRRVHDSLQMGRARIACKT